MIRGWLVVTGGIAAVLLALGRPVAAQSPEAIVTTVAVESNDCPSLSAAAVHRALEVETGGQVKSHPGAPEPVPRVAPVGRLRVGCFGDRVLLSVATSAGGRLERELAASELAGDTGPRLIALAGLELLATLDPDLRRRLSESDTSAAAPRPRAQAPHIHVTAGLVHRRFSAASGVRAWGGEISYDRRFTPRLGLAGGLELSGARRSTSSGDTTVLLFSGRVAAALRAGGDSAAVRLEAGVRAGLARLSGSAGGPDVVALTVVRPWAGPFAGVHLLSGLRFLAVDLGVEAGAALVAASGLVNERPVLEVRGVWLAMSVGLGLRR